MRTPISNKQVKESITYCVDCEHYIEDKGFSGMIPTCSSNLNIMTKEPIPCFEARDYHGEHILTCLDYLANSKES